MCWLYTETHALIQATADDGEGKKKKVLLEFFFFSLNVIKANPARDNFHTLDIVYTDSGVLLKVCLERRKQNLSNATLSFQTERSK